MFLMKKILYIGNRLNSVKATVTSVETLGNFLRQEGYTVFQASSVPNKFIRLLDMWYAVIKYRNQSEVVLIDTYSTQNFYYAVTVAWWCRLFKIPYIPILRGGNLPQRIKRSKRLSETLFKKAWENVAPSPYMYQHLKQLGFTNLRLIPNTIEIKKYPFRNQSQFQPRLLWVRSFAALYNPIMAMQVLQNLLVDFPDAQLCMVGPDKDGSLEECQAYAINHQLPVTFTGKLSKEDWVELSKNYSIFINTTHYDNTPVSVLEAMALGLPVVTTRVGGIPYLLNNEEAVLVPPDKPEEMAAAIKQLIVNPASTKEMSKKARNKVINFDWEVIKHQWNELLL